MLDSKYYDEAAKFLGKHICDSGEQTRQMMILSDCSFIDKFTFGSVNRDIDPDWVNEMKKVMKNLYEKRERTTCVACIDVRHIKGALEDTEAAQEFKALIIDSQHRITALKELCEEDAKYKSYSFWVVLYIVQSDEEIEQLLKDMDKRRPFNDDDMVTVDVRLRFIQAFKEVTVGCETRRCVTGTINHPVLRDLKVLETLKKHTKNEIKSFIQKAALEHRQRFEQANLAPKTALCETINHTKMYQLVDWQSGMWIREMLG